MKFSPSQVFLIVFAIAPISAVEIEEIADGLDRIFLGGNLTAEESKSVLSDARKGYQTLEEFNDEKDPERRKVMLTRLAGFANGIVADLARTDMTLQQLFRNVNLYLEGNSSADEEVSLKTAMPKIVGLLDRKLSQHYTQSSPDRYDVKRILSVRDGSADIFRVSDSINPTTIGFFFLESFATIIGLAWGIISMIMSDFE